MLESLTGPADLKDLTPAQLAGLSAEIRAFLVEKVSRTGGHLGPNLGVVELTLSIHRTFAVKVFSPAVTCTSLGIPPSLSAVIPEIENVSSPVSPSDAAL